MTQIPPSKDKLPNIAWYDHIRPHDKNDIYFVEGRHGRRSDDAGSRSTPYVLQKRMRQVKVQ